MRAVWAKGGARCWVCLWRGCADKARAGQEVWRSCRAQRERGFGCLAAAAQGGWTWWAMGCTHSAAAVPPSLALLELVEVVLHLISFWPVGGVQRGSRAAPALCLPQKLLDGQGIGVVMFRSIFLLGSQTAALPPRCACCRSCWRLPRPRWRCRSGRTARRWGLNSTRFLCSAPGTGQAAHTTTTMPRSGGPRRRTPTLNLVGAWI